ncbi:integrase [Nitrobacteraceae bacterium AZCC 2161]
MANNETADPPTRTSKTETGYIKRAIQLYNAVKRDFLVAASIDGSPTHFSVSAFVDRLLEKRQTYRASSWRYNRTAVVFALEQKALQDKWSADVIKDGIERLHAASPPHHDIKLPAHTSSGKSKRFFEEDFERVYNLALTRRSRFAEPLVHFLHANLLAGLRPCEWPSACLSMTNSAEALWTLTIRNAKDSNHRALGSYRELRWRELPHDLVEHVSACIAIAQDAQFERTLSSMSDLLADLTRQLWPTRHSYPTLYSTRHEAIARWKARYLHPDQTMEERLRGLAIIAALCGHATDETATKHYGRPRRGRDRITAFPVPAPDPARVILVRQVFDFGLKSFNPKLTTSFPD